MKTALHCRVAIILMLIAACVSAAPRGSSPVTLKYFGAAGWEITDGKTVVLIDPYLSRLRHVIPADDVLPTDTRQLFTNDDIARTDTAVVDAHVQRADFVLITHTHFDHALDLPPGCVRERHEIPCATPRFCRGRNTRISDTNWWP